MQNSFDNCATCVFNKIPTSTDKNSKNNLEIITSLLHNNLRNTRFTEDQSSFTQMKFWLTARKPNGKESFQCK